MSTTALRTITDAFLKLNVYLPGESPTANDGQIALRELNRMMGSWAQRWGMIQVVQREVFDLVTNQQTYTIGPGGDFNTARPPNQNSLQGAAVLLTASDPDVEVPIAILTDDGYQLIQVKTLTNSQPTAVYYNPTSTSGFGTIFVWPMPDTSVNDLVLYLQKQISAFATLATVYDFPPAYDDALVDCLTVRLSPIFGRAVPTDIAKNARNALALLERVNLRLTDLPQDAAFGTSDHRGWFNINTGQG